MRSKVLDTSNLKKLGWKPKLSLREGLSSTTTGTEKVLILKIT